MDMQERYKRYQENIKKSKLRESQQGNAIAAAPSMLARVRERVVSQMNDYNSLFGQHAYDAHCRAHFEDLADAGVRHGFAVYVGKSYVRVILQEGTTVICFEFGGEASTKASSDCAEARPNDNGDPGYWYGKDDTFVDEAFLAHRILDPVLCG
jgi:hypothetical protein